MTFKCIDFIITDHGYKLRIGGSPLHSCDYGAIPLFGFSKAFLIKCMQHAGRELSDIELICDQENERKPNSLSLGAGLSNCALWVGGQFKTGCQSILGARDFPSVLTFKSYSVLPPLVGKQCPAK